jgi:asparagine synthase (glutamine-hydrolysing)
MAWIGGIQTTVNADQEELDSKLDLMMEAACLPGGALALNPRQFTGSSIDLGRGRALTRVSLQHEGTPPSPAYTDHQNRLALIYDGYFYGSQGAMHGGSPTHQRRNGAAAEALVNTLAELPGELDEKLGRALTSLDGDYALAVSDAAQTVICRDTLGTKPLYFGQDDRFLAFASNKKPLWRIGFGEVKLLRAAMLATLGASGIATRQASPFVPGQISITDMARAVDEYEQALCSAIRKRLAGMNHLSKIGVLLSGGVDSCLLASAIHGLGPGLGIEPIAYTVGLPDSPDVQSAREFARELGIKHKISMLSIDTIEQYIPEVIQAVEDSDFVQIETGIGIYAALEVAARDGARVLLSGQGPDEEWGGYSWYPTVLSRDGREELCRRMWEDFTRADMETLDRENKIAMAWGVELVFPYLAREVVEVAWAVAPELKVVSGDDPLGKHPHRQLAIRMGIPGRYSNRAKLAIQHGTGIHGVLDQIARKNGFGPDLVKRIGYRSEDITDVKMGSSSRYGYRYAAKELWQVPQHVQLFLHALAYDRGLLDRPVRERIARSLEKAGPRPRPET